MEFAVALKLDMPHARSVGDRWLGEADAGRLVPRRPLGL